MLRLDEETFGAPRGKVVEALQAEGIPCSSGYGFSLPQQPLFRRKAFGPYLPTAAARLDYGAAACPVSDRICHEAIWFEHRLFLGSPADIDDIAAAFEKVHLHRDVLRNSVRASS